ncbi:hypothetical protein FBU30_008668 [Linnemannia zychae]|nr:hypothetical protein FBU30_008668 [Linnemannia zychae]
MVRERSRHQLVILCPSQHSLIGVNAISGLEWEWGGIDEEFIMSHVVRIPERDQPMAKGLTVTTLNGRSLILTDTTVTTGKGFKLLRQARLLSEATFYDNEGRGWIVQYIDRPLVGLTQEDQGTNPSPGSPGASTNDVPQRISPYIQDQLKLTNKHENIRASRRNIQRLKNLNVSMTYRETRRKTQARPLLTLQSMLQRFPGVYQKLEKLVMKFNDGAVAKAGLDEIRLTVDQLLTDSVNILNQVDLKTLSGVLDEYRMTVDVLDQLLENYIMNSTYDIVFFKITTQLKQQDWELAEAIRELRINQVFFQYLDLGQVGLPDTPQHFQSIVSALNEFQSIGILRTPEEKLECLVQTIRVTSTLSGGADDLIPILLLTVLRSGISNLASNLYYMKNFVLFGDASRGERGYSLSTLEAVSRYILTHLKQLSPLSIENQVYWEAVCRGDIDKVKSIYAKKLHMPNFQQAPPALSRRISTASLEGGGDGFHHSHMNISIASSIYCRDAEGNNGPLLACKAQQTDMLRYMLDEQRESIVQANYEGKTPLMIAIELQNIELVGIILSAVIRHDSDAINQQDVLGNTGMHIAASKGNIAIINELLALGAKLGVSNNDGDTPLIIAARLSEKSAQYFDANGANPDLRDWSNESPSDMTNNNTILDLLDNAMLFWDGKQSDQINASKGSSNQVQQQSFSKKKGNGSKPADKRHIRVVRGSIGQDGKIRYIVKSGSAGDKSTIVTMPRSLDDFRFLRRNLLIEVPDACIPSLEGFFSPFLLSPSRPSKTVMTITTRRLNMFLNYLSDHPVLANHELVWEFMLMPELQRDIIVERSQLKQENFIDSIFDNFPQEIENLEHEETYFKHLNDEIVKLDKAVRDVWICSRKLNRSAQDVPQELSHLSDMIDHADQINFSNKDDYVYALKSIAAAQTTMYTSDIESLGNLFEDFSYVIEGTLKALRHPQEIIDSIRLLQASAIKVEQSMRRSDMWWSGLSTIGEGAMIAFGGAGAALGAVGHAANATFESVSDTITSGAIGHQHTRSASESVVRKQVPIVENSSPLFPQPILRTIQPSSSQSPNSGRETTMVVKLSSPPQNTNSIRLTPTRPLYRQFSDVNLNSQSASSLLTSPFTSIAAVASAAVGQVPLEEIQDKIGKASSLLNSLRGSLFEELAHLQNHHTKELERAMRDFGVRQLQIEKSRLRDMMEILDDLRLETSVNETTPVPASTMGSRMDNRSTQDISLKKGHCGINRQPSFELLGHTVGVLHGISTELAEHDYNEKIDARLLLRQHAKKSSPHGYSQPIFTGNGNPSRGENDEDTISEKVSFDE